MNDKIDKKLPFWHPVWLLATCFGIGKIPCLFAPRFGVDWWKYVLLIAPIILAIAVFYGAIEIEVAVVAYILALFMRGAGTLGSLFACYLLIIIALLPRIFEFPPLYMLFIFAAITGIICISGIYICNIYVDKTGLKDPKEVIIDEVAGMFVATLLIVIGFSLLLFLDNFTFQPLLVLAPQYMVVTFLLFRLFDIWKPSIIGRIDRTMERGLGIMCDDIVAGIFAAISFFIIFFTLHYSGGFIMYSKSIL